LNETAALPETAAGDRLHPLGLFVSLVAGIPQLFLPIIAGFFGTQRTGSTHYLPFIILAVLVFSVFFRSIGWMRFRYHTGADELRIESGILERTARSIPYDRIQDVSIEQKFLPRLLGLAEVKFETGGGKGDEARLRYVSTDTAEQLRELVRARKTEGTPIAVDDQSRPVEVPPLYAMDIRRLLTLGFFSFSLIIFAVLFGISQKLDFLLPFDVWDFGSWIGIVKDKGELTLDSISWGARIFGVVAALAGLVLIGIASGMISTVLKNYGFRLDRSEKGFRRRRGLLSLTDVVMPIHRVQAATIQTGPIRKRWGWHALKFISLADDSSAGKDEKDHIVAPLATIEEIATIARIAGIDIAPDALSLSRSPASVWTDKALATIVPATIAASASAFFGHAGINAAWILLTPLLLTPFVWLAWSHSQSAITDNTIFVRDGWWRQRFTIAEHVKMQSVEIRQGPIARWRGLAHVHFGLSGGSLHIRAIPLTQAQSIRDNVVDQMCRVDYAKLGAAK
jgi:putative membrane protein